MSLTVVSHPLTGAVCGALLWWLLPACVSRMATPDDVRRQAALAAQLPLTAGLLSACLSSGAGLAKSLGVVAECLPEPACAVLADAARMAELGGGPPEVVEVFAAQPDPGWQALGAAVRRSSATGAPLSDLLHLQAEQAMTAWATAASVRARSAAVRTVLPLALCFLPAFLLLGVAPLVAGFVSRLDFL